MYQLLAVFIVVGVTEMGVLVAKKYHYNQAKKVRSALGRIITRLNPLYTPDWLLKELDESYHTSQCIEAERLRDMGR